MLADQPCLGRCDRQHDREDRDADAVVEAALDVEPLPNAGRQGRKRHDGLPKRGVGRRQHDREQQGLRPRHRSEDEQRDDEPGNDGQRQPDPEQPVGDAALLPEHAQIDPGSVSEEHDRECGLGQQLDLLAVRVEIDEPGRARAGEETGCREDHRCRDRRALEPARHGGVGEDDHGDRREEPAHGPTLSSDGAVAVIRWE
jgi:hypothetical protein